ncbi:MAG: NAD-dependent epimerase/dehydratase family protein, partial [Spirochaetia bacterium]|nr:NAD-dependent epimerase/dehydratase family protein [Spirochaetia bacterium]
MKNILIIGSLGQLGSEIALECRRRYGDEHVVLTDIRDDVNRPLVEGGPFYKIDARDGAAVARIVKDHHIDTIYHLAAVLSARAEKDPLNAWNLNMGGLITTLEVARELGCSVFTPSSIGAFGPTTPKQFTPQDTIQRPTSIYGVTKVAGELLCDYYYHKFDVDTRGIRFPGVISNMTPPGGGTTDYAVEIYYEAVRNHHYTCFLRGDTYLDMIYMPDAVEAAINSKTRAIFIESVGNPSLDVADLAAYAAMARKFHLPLIVDATFTPPPLLRSIDHGANLVIHSLSKWIGGHGTGIGGMVIDAGNFDWTDAKFALYNEADRGYHGLRFAHDLGDLNPLAFITRLRIVGLRN